MTAPRGRCSATDYRSGMTTRLPETAEGTWTGDNRSGFERDDLAIGHRLDRAVEKRDKPGPGGADAVEVSLVHVGES